MLTFAAILMSSLLAEPTHLHPPTVEQVKKLSDRFTTLWLFSVREQEKIALAQAGVKKAILPSEQPNGRVQMAFREKLERERLETFLQQQLDANAALIERLRITRVPAVPAINSESANTAPVGTIGMLERPTRVIQVLDSGSLLISTGAPYKLARLQRPTDGVLPETDLVFGSDEIFIVVGAYSAEENNIGRTLPDIKQLDTAPIKAVVQRRMFPPDSPNDLLASPAAPNTASTSPASPKTASPKTGAPSSATKGSQQKP